ALEPRRGGGTPQWSGVTSCFLDTGRGHGAATPSVRGEQDLQHGAHAGEDERDRHNDRRHLYQRPVHALPVTHVGELVEHALIRLAPRRLLGRALAERARFARREVADEGAQTLWEMGLRRYGN